MQRRGYRIGAERNVAVGPAMLGLWGALSLATIVAAVLEMRP